MTGDSEKADLRPVAVGRWRGLMLDAFRQAGLLDLFAGPAFPAPGFAGSVARFHGNIGATYRVDGPALPAPVFVKYFVSTWRSLVPLTLGRTGAARCWRAAQILIEENLPTPRPVAVLTDTRLGLHRRSVFIAEAVPHSLDKNLELYFRHNFDRRPLPPELLSEKREIIERLAELYRRVHGQDRIYFPDFHPHNLVAARTGGELSLYLVDFDEVNFHVRPDDRLRNLASLGRNSKKIQMKMRSGGIGIADRLRFLRHYLGPEAGRDQAHRLGREILANWGLR